MSLAALLSAAFVLIGCNTNDNAPDLLRVVDVAPREVESGDRLEVLGTNLPTGEAKEATITLRGTLRRPGEAPLEGQTIVIDKARLSIDKVSATVTDGLVARMCGQGEDAMHTTFHGDVIVTLATQAPGALPVGGSVKDVTLDVRPMTPRRAVVEAREKEGTRVLAFLGITVAPEAPTTGGLVIGAVRPDSPAARVQIQPGDVITSFEGVMVSSPADVIPSGEEHLPLIGIKRGAEEPNERPISIEGFHSSAPADLLGAAIIMGLAAALIFLSASPLARLVAWGERRIAGRVASRGVGRRSGTRSLAMRIAAEVRGSIAAEVGPQDGDPILVRLAPYLVFLGICATFAVMPFGKRLVGADLDVGVLFLIAMTALVTIGLVTGGPGQERWSFFGGLRAAGRILLQQLPAAAALVCVVAMTGSLRLEDIVIAQGGAGASTLDAGGWPWHWFVFRNPVFFALFLLYFTTTIAADGLAGAALPEADREEGKAGSKMGTRQLLFLFAEWAHVFVACGIASAIFLGGWQIPGLAAAAQADHVGLVLLGALVFLLKSWGLVLFVVWIRWALPRLSAEQRTWLAVRWFVPLSIGASALALAGAMAASSTGLSRNVGLVSGVVTFVTLVTLAVHGVRRVQITLREARTPLHLNPFL
ncbi:NADH-quinone oxidoreductase subunit H [Polyangium aurulentum]|nr:NADH-quinone oxidoreductase subunit H [Polyangium aurulentum]